MDIYGYIHINICMNIKKLCMCIINTATLSAFMYNTMKVATQHKMDRWRLIPIANKRALLNLATHIAIYS